MLCEHFGKHDAHYHGFGDVYHCPLKGHCCLHTKPDIAGYESVQLCGPDCSGWTGPPTWKQDDRLKVLWVMNDFAQGGLSRYTHDLFKILGDSVQFYVIYENDFQTDATLKASIPCPVVKYSREIYDSVIPSADVVTSVGVNVFTTDRDYMLSRARGKLVGQVHGTCHWSKQLVAVNAPYTREWVCVCKKCETLLPPNSTSFVPMAPIDFDRVTRKNDKQTAKENLGLGDKRVVTMPCRIAPEKGIIAASEAVKTLPEDVVLLLVGNGWSENDIIPKAQAVIGDRLIWNQWVDVPTDYLDATDVMLCLSADEGGPLTAIEALCHGTPVVSTEVGMMPELRLHHSFTGPQSIIEGMNVLVDHHSVRELFNHDRVRSLWMDNFQRWSEQFKHPHTRSRFAYFTGSNRPGEGPMIEALIRSARAAGVQEDIHAFYTSDVAGAINHRIEPTFPWKTHMGKLDLLLEFEKSDYEYVVWLDTDTYFVRDPGDLKELIRDNPCWVLMEGEALKSVHPDWWEIRLDGGKNGPTPRTGPLINYMRKYRPEGTLWTTNGGMWIVRTSAIREFYDRTYAIWHELRGMGFPRMADEPPMAIVGQTMVPDPENNTFEKSRHIWALEWNGAWRDRGKLPDGSEWPYKDWTTQANIGNVNPAIVHLMRGKHLMVGGTWQPGTVPTLLAPAPVPAPIKEPVGTRLHEILGECGVNPPPNCSCRQMAMKMDQWGIEGCQKNRAEILTHLSAASKNSSWGDWARVALKGYLSHDSLLNEAIRRCSA